MSTKTSFMHYMKWSSAFFFAVSFLIGKRSTLAKIWGAQTPFLPSFYGFNSWHSWRCGNPGFVRKLSVILRKIRIYLTAVNKVVQPLAAH